MRCAMWTRRDVLKLGIAGTGYFILGPDGKISYADESLPPSPVTTPFLDQLPLPPVALEVLDPVELANFYKTLPDEYKRYWVDINTTAFFKIVAEVRSVTVHSMLPPVAIWGYRDLVAFPPPATPTTPDVTSPFLLGPTLVQLHGAAGPPRDFSCPYSIPATQPPRPVGGGVVVRHINGLRLPKDFR